MPNYLLPCDCGNTIAVSTAQAGQMIRCDCGAQLQVPTLRGLKELPIAEAARTSSTRTWEDRHRLAFLLLVGALACFACSGYLFAARPIPPEMPSAEEVHQMILESPPAQLKALYQELSKGLTISQVELVSGEEQSQLYGWGMMLTAGLGVAGVLAALGVIFWRK